MDGLQRLRERQALNQAFMESLRQREQKEFKYYKSWYKDRRKVFDVPRGETPNDRYPDEPTYDEGNPEADWNAYQRAWNEWDWYKDLYEQRGVRPSDRRRLKFIYETYGIPVMLRVVDLPTDPAVYGKRHDNPPLLQIHTDPHPNGNFFEMAFKEVVGANPYHISLCFTSELHKFNLYNPTEGIRIGKEAYERLKRMCHGKEAFLRGSLSGNTAFNIHSIVLSDITLRIDEGDLYALHAAGTYHNRDIHISM